MAKIARIVAALGILRPDFFNGPDGNAALLLRRPRGGEIPPLGRMAATGPDWSACVGGLVASLL